MLDFSSDNDNFPLSRFELMLKTNSVYFFDANEFEEIIIYYIDNGKISLAKKALQLSFDQHPNSFSLKLIKVELLIMEDKLDEAGRLLNVLEEVEPSNEEIFVQKATIYSKKGLHKKAIDSLKCALPLVEDEVEIFSMIGMEYLFLDDFDQARLNFAKCLDVDFENYSSLYNVIYCFDMLDKHEDAINYLTNHINKDPYSEVAWHQLGRQYYTIENYKKALEAFEYAIIIDETFIGAHLEKAKALEKLGHYEEAIEFYEMTMELDTPTPFAYLRIGKCYQKLGEPIYALDFFNKTVNEDPLLDKGWLALTEYYCDINDFQKAIYYIKKAIGIDEENPEYWNMFAEINLSLSLFEEAAKAYQKSLDLNDNKLNTFVSLADVFHFLGKNQRAIEVLLLAEKKYPDFAEIVYRKACLYYVMYNKNEAYYFLEKAIQIDFEFHAEIKLIYPDLFTDEKVKGFIDKLNND